MISQKPWVLFQYNEEMEIFSSFWWNFSSLAALEVVKMTTSSAANDENNDDISISVKEMIWSV